MSKAGGGAEAAEGGGEGAEEEEEGPADMCQFCGLQDPKLAEGENMDLHFYHDCPMLCSCSECGQIIEIASVNEHLLNECENMAQYRFVLPGPFLSRQHNKMACA